MQLLTHNTLKLQVGANPGADETEFKEDTSLREPLDSSPPTHTQTQPQVGANPGADEPEFQEAASQLRERRPGVDVHFRAADGSSEGAGAVRPGGLTPACP